MTDISKQWEDYEELGKKIAEGKIKREELEKAIIIFSFFLSDTNPDYHYNATYLPHFVTDFIQFLECFHRKYPAVKQLFDVSSACPGVLLTADRYWRQESVGNEEKRTISAVHRETLSYDKKRVCAEKILIECSVLCGTKRYLYHSEAAINEIEIQKEIQNLKAFLDDKAKNERK